jgi:hypothetical protein
MCMLAPILADRRSPVTITAPTPLPTRAPRRRLVAAAIAAVALAGVATAGTLIYRGSQDDGYGGSAASVALALGCDNFQPSAAAEGSKHFHEQGTCNIDGYRVKVTTFSDTAEQRAYAVLTDTLVPVYTKRGGAYAEGAGWHVADDVSLSKDVALWASGRLGGSVHEFAAPAAP